MRTGNRSGELNSLRRLGHRAVDRRRPPEYFWWGSVFLVDVPVVLAALVAALALIPPVGALVVMTELLARELHQVSVIDGFGHCLLSCNDGRMIARGAVEVRYALGA